MRGVPGWFDVASMCRLQTYNLSQKKLDMVMGSMIMKRQCHLPPSEFCGKGQWTPLNGGVTRVQCSEFFDRGLFCTSSLLMFDHRLF